MEKKTGSWSFCIPNLQIKSKLLSSTYDQFYQPRKDKSMRLGFVLEVTESDCDHPKLFTPYYMNGQENDQRNKVVVWGMGTWDTERERQRETPDAGGSRHVDEWGINEVIENSLNN